MQWLGEGKWPRGGGGGRWAALASPPRRVALRCGSSTAHKERRGRGDGCAEPCRAVLCPQSRASSLGPCTEGLPGPPRPPHHCPPAPSEALWARGHHTPAQGTALPTSLPFPPQGDLGCQTLCNHPVLPTGCSALLPPAAGGQRRWVTRSTHPGTVSLQMQRCASFLFLSFILCAALSETFGLVLSVSTYFPLWVLSIGQHLCLSWQMTEIPAVIYPVFRCTGCRTQIFWAVSGLLLWNARLLNYSSHVTNTGTKRKKV